MEAIILNIYALDGLTGRVVTSENPEYNKLRQEYNRAIQKYPLAIVYCRNKNDISNAVLWSIKHKIPLRIRNGGHNYEGYSTGDAVLVIDLSELNGLYLDEEANLLKVQGGVKNRQLYEFISSRGYPFPGGTCPTVGVSGYALGGGWGLSCRYLGLGCDSLVELEMVNYEGTIKKANRKQNADLFWACRGAGGGNFGVVVSMTFRLPPKTGKVTLIELKYLHANQKKQALFLQAWQEWLRNADERITMISRIYNSPDDGLAIEARGIFYGPAEEAEESIKPLTGLGGAKYSLEYLTFLEAITIIENLYPPSEKFESASRFVLRDFSSYEGTKIVGLIKERPKGSVFAGLSLYALGGRVAQVSKDETAFFYRKAKYILWLETVFEDSQYTEANSDWVARNIRYIEPVTEGSYVNFPYGGLTDYLEEYYGLHVGRLRKVKENYDPFNVFRFPQSIDRFTGMRSTF